jgi:hypothetical protein
LWRVCNKYYCNYLHMALKILSSAWYNYKYVAKYLPCLGNESWLLHRHSHRSLFQSSTTVMVSRVYDACEPMWEQCILMSLSSWGVREHHSNPLCSLPWDRLKARSLL